MNPVRYLIPRHRGTTTMALFLAVGVGLELGRLDAGITPPHSLGALHMDT